MASMFPRGHALRVEKRSKANNRSSDSPALSRKLRLFEDMGQQSMSERATTYKVYYVEYISTIRANTYLAVNITACRVTTLCPNRSITSDLYSTTRAVPSVKLQAPRLPHPLDWYKPVDASDSPNSETGHLLAFLLQRIPKQNSQAVYAYGCTVEVRHLSYIRNVCFYVVREG